MVEEAFKRGAVRTARGKPWTEAELKLLMDMAAQGLNPQQIFDSGKLPGRTLRAIGKQAYCSIVRTFPTAIVHTIDEFSNRFVGVWLNMTGVYCCCFFRRYFVFLRVCT